MQENFTTKNSKEERYTKKEVSQSRKVAKNKYLLQISLKLTNKKLQER